MQAPPRRLVVAVVLGTILNPLNSSMIAVALVPLRRDFHVDLAQATWLVSAFYLAGAVAQPLMGRLADLFGARRVFLSGLALAGLASALAPLAPSIGWLVGLRVILASGTSATYPAGLALIRASTRANRVPAAALASISMAASVSAAVGPTLGGFLLVTTKWQGIFLVNVPLTVTGLILGSMWLPAVRPAGSVRWRDLDLAGAVLFTAAVLAPLGFLLSLQSGPFWPLLPAIPLLFGLLIWRERRVSEPVLDVRMLAENGPLVGVYVQFAAVTFVFYSIFYGVPIWLEQARGLDPRSAGLMVLPITGLSILVTPLAARLVTGHGPRPALLIGSAMLTVGTLSLLTYSSTTPLVALVLVALLLGVPNGFNNLGLQASLYEAVPPEHTASAAGQFQTFRYVGAILSTTLLAIVFHSQVSSAGLHLMATVLAGISAALLLTTLIARPNVQFSKSRRSV